MGVVCHEAQEERHDLEETAVFKVCLATVCASSVRGSQREEAEALASLPSHYWVVILIAAAAIRQSVSIFVLTLSLRRKHIL